MAKTERPVTMPKRFNAEILGRNIILPNDIVIIIQIIKPPPSIIPSKKPLKPSAP